MMNPLTWVEENAGCYTLKAYDTLHSYIEILADYKLNKGTPSDNLHSVPDPRTVLLYHGIYSTCCDPTAGRGDLDWLGF